VEWRGVCAGTKRAHASYGQGMWCLHGVSIWGVYMGCLHGVSTWGVYMGCLHGVSTWCVYTFTLRVVLPWCVHLLPSRAQSRTHTSRAAVADTARSMIHDSKLRARRDLTRIMQTILVPKIRQLCSAVPSIQVPMGVPCVPVELCFFPGGRTGVCVGGGGGGRSCAGLFPT
jgi:hypothetical protein